MLHFDSTSMLVVWMSWECKVDQSSIHVRGFVWVLRLPAISRVVAQMSLVNESGIYFGGVPMDFAFPVMPKVYG